jgi:hypothetical protein
VTDATPSLRPALQPPYLTVDLPAGSLVVERYTYESNRTGNPGVQWLAEVVDKDGNLRLMMACRTRRGALEVLRRDA